MSPIISELISLAIRYGLPALEAALPASVATIIQDILSIIEQNPTAEGIKMVQDHVALLK